MTRSRLVFLAPLVVALGLTGCTGLPESGEKGYVTGDGLVRVIDEADREDPIDLEAVDLDGEPLGLAEGEGMPQVVVVWGSWCVECRAEQDDVNEAAEQLGDRARFIGLNGRENSVPAALAYEREFGVPYDSIDSNGAGAGAILAFRGTLSYQTFPAFVVLDEQGRVGGTILGALPSTQTLVDLVDEVSTAGSQAGSADG